MRRKNSPKNCRELKNNCPHAIKCFSVVTNDNHAQSARIARIELTSNEPTKKRNSITFCITITRQRQNFAVLQFSEQ